MAKVIALSDEAYRELQKMKSKKESFSTAVLKLVAKKRRRSLLDFAGKWPGDTKLFDKVFEDILEGRSSHKMRKVGF
ncbi:MAG: antitoxin VapB family protein [Candidatus Micrarchaeaceae archaeon]